MKTLDVRNVDLVVEGLTMVDFKMSRLSVAFQGFIDLSQHQPEEIIMTNRQFETFKTKLRNMGEVLGLNVLEDPPKWTFRGTEIKTKP